MAVITYDIDAKVQAYKNANGKFPKYLLFDKGTLRSFSSGFTAKEKFTYEDGSEIKQDYNLTGWYAQGYYLEIVGVDTDEFMFEVSDEIPRQV